MSSVNKNSNASTVASQPFNSNQSSTNNLPIVNDSGLLRPFGLAPVLSKPKGEDQSQSSFDFTSKQGKSSQKNSIKTKGQEVVSITYEEIGLFPRSFSRVLDRFLKQIFSDVENLVIQEYRFYRYLFLTTLKCLFILFFVPFLVNILAKTYIVRPLTEYYWNTKQTEIFLNSYQQKRAFAELKEFEEKTYFESLIFPKSVFKPNLHNSSWFASQGPEAIPLGLSNQGEEEKESNNQGLLNYQDSVLRNPKGETQTGLNHNLFHQTNLPLIMDSLATKSSPSKEVVEVVSNDKEKMDDYKQTESLIHSYTMKSSLFVYQTQEADKNIQQRYQEKTIELAQRYNDQSIEAITNFFADLISLFTLFYLLYVLEIQINITKSFLLEVFFGLDDSKKSLLILLITDLLVGYHSSNLWELFFEFLFHHYGLPESQTGIFLLVATLPVLLDVLFKYLIFRHLNRSSPATVATYHAMIE